MNFYSDELIPEFHIIDIRNPFLSENDFDIHSKK